MCHADYSQWQNGRRGQDGWGRWTRRRKWYRDAELVEVDASELPHELDGTDIKESTPKRGFHSKSYSTTDEKMISPMRSEPALRLHDPISTDDASIKTADDALSVHSTSSRSFFRTPSLMRRVTDRSAVSTAEKDRPRRASDAVSEEEASGLGIEVELELQKQGKEGGEWGIGDEARMSLE